MSKPINPPPDAGSQMPDPADDANFEQMLRAALRARPEPAIPLDLAGKAMRLARTRDATLLKQRAERLAQQRWWAQVTGAAAALIIGAMLTGAAHRLWTRGDITSLATFVSSKDSTSTSAPGSTATSSDDDSTTTTSTTSSTGIIASVFVGELLLIGMLLASLSRGGPPGTWTSEAVAGLY